MVIDHGSYAVSGTEGDHTLIAAGDFIQSDVLLGSTKIEVSSSSQIVGSGIAIFLYMQIMYFITDPLYIGRILWG